MSNRREVTLDDFIAHFLDVRSKLGGKVGVMVNDDWALGGDYYIVRRHNVTYIDPEYPATALREDDWKSLSEGRREPRLCVYYEGDLQEEWEGFCPTADPCIGCIEGNWPSMVPVIMIV